MKEQVKLPPPAPAEPSAEIEAKLTHPRCPFCHEDVAAGAEQRGCPGCRAWHHQACWDESASRCAACGREEAVPAAGETGPGKGLYVSWALLGGLVLLLQAAVLPAFSAMFLEVGVRLPEWTEFALGRWRWALAMLPLTALFMAASARRERSRSRWSLAAWLLGVGLVGFYAWALFLPLITVMQQL
jgi:hypothetical protein